MMNQEHIFSNCMIDEALVSKSLSHECLRFLLIYIQPKRNKKEWQFSKIRE